MTKVTVTPLSDQKINWLQESWNRDDFKKIIELLGGEYADLDPSEIEEYMNMMIADNEVQESAYVVLKYALGEALAEGQLRNLSNEMEDDKMWEEYPNMAHHKDIFCVNNLLYRAYNGKLSKGEALVLELKAVSNDKEIIQLLSDDNPDAIFRLIMAGCNERAKINRLYADEEAEKFIDDARHILWQINTRKISDQEVIIKVTSSTYWLDSFEAENTFTVNINMDIYERQENEAN